MVESYRNKKIEHKLFQKKVCALKLQICKLSKPIKSRNIYIFEEKNCQRKNLLNFLGKNPLQYVFSSQWRAKGRSREHAHQSNTP